MFIAEVGSPQNLSAILFVTQERSPYGHCASTPIVAAGFAALGGQAVVVSAQVAYLVSGQAGYVALVSG